MLWAGGSWDPPEKKLVLSFCKEIHSKVTITYCVFLNLVWSGKMQFHNMSGGTAGAMTVHWSGSGPDWLLLISPTYPNQQFLCQSQVVSASLHLLGLHQPLWIVCLLPRLHSARHTNASTRKGNPVFPLLRHRVAAVGSTDYSDWIKAENEGRGKTGKGAYQFSLVPAMVWKNYDKKLARRS